MTPTLEINANAISKTEKDKGSENKKIVQQNGFLVSTPSKLMIGQKLIVKTLPNSLSLSTA